MSLADELLADLEDAGEEAAEDVKEEEMDMIEEVEEADPDIDASQSVRSIAKLSSGRQLSDIMEQIECFQGRPKRTSVTGPVEADPEYRRTSVSGPVEADPEYRLIVDANNLTVEIDNEIDVIHKFARDIYRKRFPELDSLIQTPIEYMRTVKELGNDILEKCKNNVVLQEILTPATIMVVSVTSSTTQGTVLDDDELSRVLEACDMALSLVDSKTTIFDYVESRMTFIAPNLSVIVGASTAAKIMGLAGGLTNLCKMPACNILVLGAQKKTLSGFSSTAILPHTGFIYYSQLVQNVPPDLRRKVARLVTAKCTLAARVDNFHESSDGRVGDNLRAEIEQKLDKLLEPPPVKKVKALPTPIDAPRKKRGGRRARKMKERLGITEMRKHANRMNFGDIEDDAYQEDLGFSLGNIKKNSGRVRGLTVDSKIKARISKTLQQKIQKQNTVWGGSTTVRRQVSGTASSVAFTPLQGLEIVNPLAAEKRTDGTNSGYFSSTASFLKVKK